MRVQAVKGACTVRVGVAGSAHALWEASEAKTSRVPAGRFCLVRPAVASIVVCINI